MTESTSGKTERSTLDKQGQTRQTPALKQIRKIAIPNMVRQSPAIKQVKKDPDMEKATQSPAVEQIRQSPDMEKVKKSPALQQVRQTAKPEETRLAAPIKQSEQVNTAEKTPPPAVEKQKIEANITKKDAPVVAVEKKVEASTTKKDAPAVAVEQKAEASITKKDTPAVAVEKKVEASTTKMDAPAVAIEQKAEASTTKKDAPAVAVEKKVEASTTKKDAPAVAVEKKVEASTTKMDAPAVAVEKKVEASTTKKDAPVVAVEQQQEVHTIRKNSPAATGKHAKRPPTLLGQISKENPTVSDVMINSGHLGDKSWEIIHAQINQNKPYTKLREGTKIFLDSANNELFFRDGKGTEGVSLGTLNKNAPTISHLLASSEFDREKWQILSLPVNADKDFRHIPAGSEVRIDPQTKEISWGKISPPFSLQPNSFLPDSSIPAREYRLMQESSSIALQGKAEDLSAAVQKFIGTPYSKMDCYGLVVKGLENIGVQYGGKKGLYNRLTSMAKEKGLPANAFLTGEGLVEAAGSKVLYETFPTVKKPEIAAEKTLEKMSRLLEKGQILSFSTPTRGHTGVISKQNDGEWTFINSGYMDHSVKTPQTRKGVGEEGLLAELTNWFTLASKRREPLTVTLGKVDLAKLQKQQESSGTLLASI